MKHDRKVEWPSYVSYRPHRSHIYIYKFVRQTEIRISRISLRTTRLQQRLRPTGFAYLLFPVARNSSVYRETLQNSIEILELAWFGRMLRDCVPYLVLVCRAFVHTHTTLCILKKVKHHSSKYKQTTENIDVPRKNSKIDILSNQTKRNILSTFTIFKISWKI